MPNSTRKCSHCKQRFRPQQQFPGPVAWCSPECGKALALNKLPKHKEKKRKEQKAITRQQKEAIKTKPELTKEAQKAFNAYIRERDHGKPCISCGAVSPSETRGGSWDCSHYRSVGANPELRFEELNAHKACKKCNSYLSGNIANYRIGLRNRIGDEALEWLEGFHPPKHYTKDQIRAIRDYYRKKVREIKRAA